MNLTTSSHKRIIDSSLLATYKTKNHPFDSIPTLENWLLYWLEGEVREKCKPTTYTNFHSYIHSHILPLLGDYRIDEITTIELQYYVDLKLMEGRLDNKGGLSVKTVKEHMTVLKLAFKKAIEQQLISLNPASSVVFVKEKREEVPVLSNKEQHILSQHITHRWSPNSLLTIFLGEYAGLRIGEIAALRLNDLDLEKRMICIDESLNRVGCYDQNNKMKYILKYGTTKSNRIRYVPMNDDIYVALKEYLETMPQELKCDLQNPLFTNTKGTVMEPRCISYHFKKFMMELDMNSYHFHCLRHTFATRCLELDMNVKYCSMILGHGSTEITQNRYIHTSEYQMHKEMSKLNMKAIIQLTE